MIGGGKTEREREEKMGRWIRPHQNLFYLKVLSGVLTLVHGFVNYWSSSLRVKKKRKEKKRAENTLRLDSREIRAVGLLLQKGSKGQVGLNGDPDTLGLTLKFSSLHTAAS